MANEAFCLSLAGSVQLISAKAKMYSVNNRPFLLVERYDRIVDSVGGRARLHQEDFCQALGVVPEMKYQNGGGPDLAQCFKLVRQVTRPSAPQVLRLLDYVIFNALVGNHDAHAKNFSLLYSHKTPDLAPFYDTLSTAVYPELTPKMAMKIGSKYKFTEMQARHWDQFAEAAGLARSQTRRRLLELANLLPPAARTLHSDARSGFANHPMIKSIVAVIEQRCALMIARLAS